MSRAIVERRAIRVLDLQAADEEYPRSVQAARLGGVRSFLTAPLLRGDEAFGVIAVLRDEVRAFTDEQVGLLQTFADQAVIAIENARLFTELQERLEEQTATAEVLRVISESPTELQKVLDTIATAAARLSGTDDAIIRRVEGSSFRVMAHHGTIAGAAPVGTVHPLTGPNGQAVLERRTIHVPDLAALPEEGNSIAVSLYRDFGIRSFLVVPMLRGDVGIGTITVRRLEPGSFSDRLIKLLETFADQAVIAIANTELFQELQDRNHELSDALERQTATSEILRVISSSPTNLQPVLETIVSNAARLCGGSRTAIFRANGDRLMIVADCGLDDASRELIQRSPAAIGAKTSAGRAALLRQVICIPDVLADPAYGRPELPLVAGYRSALAVPLVRENDLLGVLLLIHPDVDAYSDDQIKLIQTFADQAVIAIENTRLFTELQQRLEEQTATAEVLRVISESPTDLPRVLDAIASAAARLCSSDHAVIWRVEVGGIRLLARYGPLLSLPVGTLYPLDRESVVGRTILERRTIHIPDFTALPENEYQRTRSSGRELGTRSTLSVPLSRGDLGIGTIVIRRVEPKPFTDRQIKLLQSFADQAVIAISNTELFDQLQERNRSLTEALERQTATSEILRVIASSPTDLQHALDTIAESAGRLCDAPDADIWRLDGDTMRKIATYGSNPRLAVGETIPLTGVMRHAVMDRRTVHVPDVFSESGDEYPEIREDAARLGILAFLATPLTREGVAIGVILIRRSEARPFTESQVGLLESFANQAVIAIENSRLIDELQQRLEEQTATAEVLRVISESSTELQKVLDTIAAAAARLCGTNHANIWRVEAGGLRLVTRFGDLPGPPVDGTLTIDREGTAGRAILDRKTIQIPDIAALPEGVLSRILSLYRTYSIRSILSVPLLRGDVAIGVIAIHRLAAGPFSDRLVKLLETFADQAVIAISNAELFQQLQERNRELSEALEQQTATSEILRVIASSPTDLQAVLDTIAQNAASLCDAEYASVSQLDGEVLRRAGLYGPNPDVVVDRVTPLTRDAVSGRAVLERRTIHAPDFLGESGDDFPITRERAMQVGARAFLATPLMREGTAIGVIVIRRFEARPFTAAQVSLLESFADQAVIAIENSRLIEELKQRLEEQTATAEVLRVISESPTELNEVLETIAAAAARLCKSASASINRVEADGLRIVTRYGDLSGLPIGMLLPFSRETISVRAVLERRTTQVPDIAALPEEGNSRYFTLYRDFGIRSVLVVPMLRGDVAIGSIMIRRLEPGLFSDRLIKLMETFADQAVIAISNAELFQKLQDRNRELKDALEQQTVTSEVLRVIASSPTDLPRVLDTIAESAARLSDATTASIQKLDGDHLLVVGDNYNSHPTAARADLWVATKEEGLPGTPATMGTASGRAMFERRTIHTLDMAEAVDTEFPDSKAIQRIFGQRSQVATPLLREGQSIGVLNVHRYEVGSPADLMKLARPLRGGSMGGYSSAFGVAHQSPAIPSIPGFGHLGGPFGNSPRERGRGQPDLDGSDAPLSGL